MRLLPKVLMRKATLRINFKKSTGRIGERLEDMKHLVKFVLLLTMLTVASLLVHASAMWGS